MVKLTEFEEKLFEALVQKYRERGVNFQKILDNPLFLQLPLVTKLEVIKRYAEELGARPKLTPSWYRTKEILKPMASSAAMLMASGAIANLSQARAVFKGQSKQLAILGAVGLGLGAMLGASKISTEYDRDKETAAQIAEGQGLEALAGRTLLPTGAITPPPVLSAASEFTRQLYNSQFIHKHTGWTPPNVSS